MTASDSDRLTGEIGEWLTARFPTLSVPELPVRGTYGLVWLAPHADGSPGGVALKTIDPGRIRDKTGRHAYADFERELHVWLRVPMHQNVVAALGIEHAELTTIPDPRWQRAPIARMSLYACSLRQWVNAAECPAVDEIDRMIALAEACHGLVWLNQHGVEGHGDLKPENILVRDLNRGAGLPDHRLWPGRRRPWRASVADLGWADVWKHEPLFDKGWRPYVAPERLHRDTPRFVPTASDVFSMGVVIAELLDGQHPAGHSVDKVAKRNDRDWLRIISRGSWHLARVEQVGLGDVVRAALSVDPEKRPTMVELRDALVAAIEKEGQLEMVRDVLEAHDRVARSQAGNAVGTAEAWAASSLGSIGSESLAEQIAAVASAKLRIDPHSDPRATREWFDLASAEVRLLLRRGGPGDEVAAFVVARDAAELAVARFAVDLRSAYGYGESFEVWEPVWGAGIAAVNDMHRIRGPGDPDVIRLRATLEALREERAPPLEEWLASLRDPGKE